MSTGKAGFIYRNKATGVLDEYPDQELLGLSRMEYLRALDIDSNQDSPRTRLVRDDTLPSFGQGVFLYARHVCRADGLKETLSPNQREDNP